jgi:hypothetical protein
VRVERGRRGETRSLKPREPIDGLVRRATPALPRKARSLSIMRALSAGRARAAPSPGRPQPEPALPGRRWAGVSASSGRPRAKTPPPPRRSTRPPPAQAASTPADTADPADPPAPGTSTSLKALLAQTSATSAASSLDADYVVIGSGIGGLCAGALLARYGASVTVLEAHDRPGGAAHGFTVGGFEFDAGPSFFAGLSAAPGGGGGSPPASIPTNPLSQVLSALGEAVPCVGYDRWVTHLGDGAASSPPPFPVVADGAAFRAMVRAQGGPAAAEQ